jgi:hypothetical protein
VFLFLNQCCSHEIDLKQVVLRLKVKKEVKQQHTWLFYIEGQIFFVNLDGKEIAAVVTKKASF